MALPIWDPGSPPPGVVSVQDISEISDQALREQMQGMALQIWMDETGQDPIADPRPWDPAEIICAMYGETGTFMGITFTIDPARIEL